MEARERERCHSRRPSIKRPWEEDAVLPETGNAWIGATLPPIDPVPYRRTSLSRQAEAGGNLHNLYQPDNRDVGAKRVRYEGNNDYISVSDGKLPFQAPRKSSRNPTLATRCTDCLTNPVIHIPHQRTFDSPGFQERHGGEPADAEDTAILCLRCRRLTTQVRDVELESCEACERNPELALVAQKAAQALTQLANTLVSGISSVRRGVIRVSLSGSCSPFPPLTPLVRWWILAEHIM
jgi:hypothetical protein